MRGQRKNRQTRKSGRDSSRNQGLSVRGTFTSQKAAVHKYVRTTSSSYSLTPATGWNGTSNFDLELAFTLNNTLVYLGGALAFSLANPGASDFISLYDEYRIAGVEVSFMYGANAVAGGPATTSQLPILDIVFDPSDTSVTSLSSVLQYENLRTVQLGNQRTSDGFVVKCCPVPTIDRLTTGMIPKTAPFITVDDPATVHNGLKIFYDSGGSTSAAVTGLVTMYFRYFFEMKLSH